MAYLGAGHKTGCDPLTYWRCSRSECNRCYRPDMGTFDLDRERGDSIKLRAQAQEKCHRHSGLTFDPFMWIAKSGKGRRFACPVKGCRCVGPVVAEIVSDLGEKEEPQAAMAVLRGEAKKAAFELSVFIEFAKVAPLAADAPENGGRGRPDIRCRIDGREYWFELGRIADEILAEQINRMWPKNPRPFQFEQEEPFERIMKQKAVKTYQTDGHPVDLVLHFDHQPPDRTAIQRHVAQHAGTLDELTKRFSRVWVYDGWSKSMLRRSVD